MAGTRSCGSNQNQPPLPSEPTTAQLLRLIMEERQAAREERQAHLTALQQLAANFGPNNTNNNNNNGNEDGGNQRSTLSDF